MKRFWLMGLTVLTMALTGCEKESSTKPDGANKTARIATLSGKKIKTLTVDQLPVSIRTYLQNQYAGAIIKQGGQGPRGNYGVLIVQNGIEKAVVFKADGTFKTERELKHNRLDPTTLPGMVTDYLHKQYPGSTVKRASQGPRGNYAVAIQTGDAFQVLLFDSKGGFLHGWKPREGGQLLETSELPASLTTYVNSQYSGVEIQRAGQGPRGNFLVVIEQKNTRKLLVFNQAGTFVRELSR